MAADLINGFHQDLLKFVEAELTNVTIHKLKAGISSFKSNLLQPFAFPGPNATHRQQIQAKETLFKGSKIEVNPMIQQEIIKLSDEFKLDEFLCLEIWQKVSDVSVRQWLEDFNRFDEGVLVHDIAKAARYFHLTAITLSLQVMCVFLKSCFYTDISSEKQAFLLEEVTMMVEEDLVTNLLSALSNQSAFFKSCGEIANLWKSTMFESLGMIFSNIQILPSESTSLIKLVQSYSEELNTLLRDNLIQTDSESVLARQLPIELCSKITFHFESVVALLIGLICSWTQSDDDKIKRSNSRSNAGCDEIQQLISNKASWHHAGTHGVIVLAWIVLNKKNRAVTDQLIGLVYEQGAFPFLGSMINQSQDVAPILQDLMIEFLSNIDTLKYSKDLMKCVASLFARESSRTEWFWTNKAFVEACSHAVEKDASLFNPFIRLVTAAALGPEGSAEASYQFMKRRSSRLSWDHFFTTLQRYIGLYQQPATRTNNATTRKVMINPAEVDALVSILELIQAVTRVPALRNVFLQNQQWQILTTLFHLLYCPVDSKLKGCLMKCLAILARSESYCNDIWSCIEDGQLLITRSYNGVANVSNANDTTSFGLSGGIRYELDQIESLNRAYPATCGFIALMNELLGHPIPRELRIEPYLDFLIQQVFLKYPTRQYEDENEKWFLVSGILSIFNTLISENDQILQLFLSDSDVLRTLFDILTLKKEDTSMKRITATLLLNKTTDATRTSVLRNNVIVLALQLIQKIMARDEACITRARISTSSIQVEPFHALLFRTKRDLIVELALYIRDDSSAVIPRLSVEILAHLTQRIPSEQLWSVFQDSELAYSVAIGYADCLRNDTSDDTLSKPNDVTMGPDVLSRFECPIEGSSPKGKLRTLILELLLNTCSERNWSHVLLFNNRKNCLQVIIELLDSLDFVFANPEFAELCHSLLYKLSIEAISSKQTSQFLNGFYVDQFQYVSTILKLKDHSCAQLSMIVGWILRGVALDYYQHQPEGLLALLWSQTAGTFEQTHPLLIEILTSIAVEFGPVPQLKSRKSNEILAVAEQVVLRKQCGGSLRSYLHIPIDLLHQRIGGPERTKDTSALEWAVEYNAHAEQLAAEESILNGWNCLLQLVLPKIQTQEHLYEVFHSILALVLSNRTLNAEFAVLLAHSSVSVIAQLRLLSSKLSTDQVKQLLADILLCIESSTTWTGQLELKRNARKYFYASLLHVMRYAEVQQLPDHEFNLSVKLLDIICKDAADPISSCLCLSVLESMIQPFCVVMKREGYLAQFLTIFPTFIEQSSRDSKLKPVMEFALVSTLSFFIKLASYDPMGALSLVEYGLIQKLTFLKPHMNPLIWNSMLRLLNCIANSMKRNQKAASQLCGFVMCYHKEISRSFKSQDEKNLSERAYISGIFAFIASIREVNLMEKEFGPNRLKKYTKYQVDLLSKVLSASSREGQLALAHTALYCQFITTYHGAMIFEPKEKPSKDWIDLITSTKDVLVVENLLTVWCYHMIHAERLHLIKHEQVMEALHYLNKTLKISQENNQMIYILLRKVTSLQGPSETPTDSFY